MIASLQDADCASGSLGKVADLSRWALIDLPLSFASLRLWWSAEMVRFAGRRLCAQADYLSALSDCDSYRDFKRLQSHFVNWTLADYRNETMAVAKEVQQATAEAA